MCLQTLEAMYETILLTVSYTQTNCQEYQTDNHTAIDIHDRRMNANGANEWHEYTDHPRERECTYKCEDELHCFFPFNAPIQLILSADCI